MFTVHLVTNPGVNVLLVIFHLQFKCIGHTAVYEIIM